MVSKVGGGGHKCDIGTIEFGWTFSHLWFEVGIDNWIEKSLMKEYWDHLYSMDQFLYLDWKWNESGRNLDFCNQSGKYVNFLNYNEINL